MIKLNPINFNRFHNIFIDSCYPKSLISNANIINPKRIIRGTPIAFQQKLETLAF